MAAGYQVVLYDYPSGNAFRINQSDVDLTTLRTLPAAYTSPGLVGCQFKDNGSGGGQRYVLGSVVEVQAIVLAMRNVQTTVEGEIAAALALTGSPGFARATFQSGVAAVVYYYAVNGFQSTTIQAASRYSMPAPTRIRKITFNAYLSSGAAIDNPFSFRVEKNGVDVGTLVSYAAGETGIKTMSTPIDFVAGDIYAIRLNQTGGTATGIMEVNIVIDWGLTP